MRTITSLRALVRMGALLTVAACGDVPVEPRQTTPWIDTDVAGDYQGMVGSGSSLTGDGEVAITIEQDGNSLSGDMSVVAEFGQAGETVSLAFSSTYTGTVTQGYPVQVALLLDNPVCGGTTEFTGTYSMPSLHLTGQYVHKDPEGCEPVATIDLSILVTRAS